MPRKRWRETVCNRELNLPVRKWVTSLRERRREEVSRTAPLVGLPAEGGWVTWTFAAGDMHWINTMFSNSKRSMNGACHALGLATYEHLYLAEADWGFEGRLALKILVPRLQVNCDAT